MPSAFDIEIHIIGGIFTYPPEGERTDTRIVSDTLTVPHGTSLAAIRTKATHRIKYDAGMHEVFLKHISVYDRELLEKTSAIRDSQRKAFVFGKIGQHGEGFKKPWLNPVDSEVRPGLRITTRHCELYRRRWTTFFGKGIDSETYAAAKADIAARDELTAYYGIFYPAGDIKEPAQP